MANNKNRKPLEFGMNTQSDDSKDTANTKTKGNFTAALKEIFGEKEAPVAQEPAPKAAEPAKKQQPATPTTARNSAPATPKAAVAPAPAATPTPAPAPSAPAHKSFQPAEPIEQTFITKDTIIQGSIITKSDIKISGCMKGNLTSEHDIFINGQIDGDVKGNAVTLNNGVVKGNITSKTYITLNEKSIVIGDLSGDTVESDGKVKGDLRLNTSVSLKSNAVVHGNITSRNINMLDGSVIKGSLEIICDDSAKEDDAFDIEKQNDEFVIPDFDAMFADNQ